MISLKAFAHVIADAVGVSHTAVYERQRALARSGLLPAPRRGKGNGLEAKPDTVALVILSLMVTDSLVETDKRIKKWAIAKARSRCSVTGETTFKNALAKILAVPALAQSVHSVEVNRTQPAGVINFKGHKAANTEFGDYSQANVRLRLFVDASMWGGVFADVSEALEAGVSEPIEKPF